MSSFNEIFDNEKSFTVSTKATMPMDRARWDEFILSNFLSTIQLPNDAQPQIEYIQSDDTETVVLGAVRVKLGDTLVSFPFIIKNGKLSPFDIFVTGGKTFPAASIYLEKLFNREGLGEIIKKDLRRPGSMGLSKTLGGTFVGQSLPEVMRLMDSNKMASYLKANLPVAEIYATTKKGTLLNSVLEKISAYKKAQQEAKDKVTVLSAVAHPVSKGSVKVGMLTNKGYTENIVNFGMAEKLYPAEIAYIVKKAETNQDISHTYSLTSEQGQPYPNSARLPLVAITGPHMTDGNMLDWTGDRLNYNIKVNTMLPKISARAIVTGRKVIFNRPDTTYFTPPVYITSKKNMAGVHTDAKRLEGAVVIDGVDSFDRKIRIVIDPSLKHIYVANTEPFTVHIPEDWPIHSVPVSAKGTPGSESSKKVASFLEATYKKVAQLKTEYNPFTDLYTVVGAPDKANNGNGFSWIKAATILNHYIGDTFKRAFKSQNSIFHLPEVYSTKTAAVNQVEYPSDPIFIKLAAIVPNEQTADTLLGFNYMTPNVLDDADDFMPKLEEAASDLSDLLLTSRLTESLPEDDIKKAIIYIIKVVQSLRDTLKAKEQMDDQNGLV